MSNNRKNLANILGLETLTAAQKIAGVVLSLAIVTFVGIFASGFIKTEASADTIQTATPATTPAYIGMLDFTDKLIDLGVKKAEADRLARTTTVSFKTGSAEEDLEVQIVDEDGNLIVGPEFILTIKAVKGSYNKDWSVNDGYLHLTKIDGGEYTVSIAEKEYYIMPEPITVKVEKKVDKNVIDVSDLLKDESEIDASKEDASFGNASQTPSAPPKVEDTVEYIASSSKEVIKSVDVKKYTFLPYSITDNNMLKDKNGNDTKYYALLDENGNITQVYYYNDLDPSTQTLQASPTGYLINNKAFRINTLLNIKTNNDLILLNTEIVPDGNTQNENTPIETTTPPTETSSESTETGGTEQLPTPTPPTETSSESTEISGNEQLPTPTPPQSTETSSSENNSSSSNVESSSQNSSSTNSDSSQSSSSSSESSQDSSQNSQSSSTTNNGEKVIVNFINEDGTLNSQYADIIKVTETTVKEDKKVTVYYGWQTIDGSRYFYDKNGNAVKGTQIIQGISYFFDSRGKLSTGVTQAIDVSKWNGNIDWNKVKERGITQVIIRVGYRGYGSGALVIDPTFVQNIKGAKARGLKVGLYFFTQAISAAEAVEEASLCVKALRDTGYGLELPIYFDSEYSTSAKTGRADKLSQTLRTEIAKAFCETIQNAGYRAGIYRSKTWFYYQLNFSQISQYSIWVAHYTQQTDFKYHYDIWQYTGSGSCPGVNTAVDKNYVYRSF